MSDWGGSHSAVASMYSGNDLIEPGGNPNEVINATTQTAPTINISGLSHGGTVVIKAFSLRGGRGRVVAGSWRASAASKRPTPTASPADSASWDSIRMRS